MKARWVDPVRSVLLSIMTVVSLAAYGQVDVPVSEDAAPTSDQAAPSDVARGEVGTLIGLIQDKKVDELRTVYNAEYGASEFFDRENLVYFVALFQFKRFWKVVRTDRAGLADQLFKQFVSQSAQLSEVERNRVLAQAWRDRYDKEVASAKRRVEAMQADLSIERAQSAQVDAHQAQMRQGVLSLESEQSQAREQLSKLRAQERRLQQELQGNLTGTSVEMDVRKAGRADRRKPVGEKGHE
ncbi:DUF2968 domain-containing protein [Burkholderia vietnamiensis]|uniref:DUF2968 domain-containing protein n=1 Tax=Burkholderia vietnamiensis TaxID=60552 RepID=UPI0009BC1486|nr:DUF2968 domain-containing protein [Burkholderia vietnamiensis]TPQ32639.1 DUF2968 domain-containing protein [Burkholderia ubonensis]HDR9090150.1 DUF2968 domain-containing protein [Burkholderia vietnamiensis]